MPTEILRIKANKQLFIIQADIMLKESDLERLKSIIKKDIESGCLILPLGLRVLLTPEVLKCLIQESKGGNKNADENK